MTLHWILSSVEYDAKSIAGLHMPSYVDGARQSFPTPAHNYAHSCATDTCVDAFAQNIYLWTFGHLLFANSFTWPRRTAFP